MVDVDDEDDFQLGMEQAMRGDKSMNFFAHFQKSAYPELEEKKEPASTRASDDAVMSSGEDERPAKGLKRGKKGGKQGIPRKALKNLINNELQTQSKEVFSELLKSKDLCGALPKDEDDELYDDPQEEVIHLNVACDGCGVEPIKGIRYKCSIRKNFDLCSLCEERLPNEYPMLKIRKNGGAPDVLINMLPESAPETQEEREQRTGQRQETAGETADQTTGRGQERCGFGFGRGGRGRGGHGGHGGRGGFGGRGGHGPGKGFMQMVSGFMEKMGGKDACMQMKQDWCKTMQEGTEEQKQEQWTKFGEKMSQFGEHAKEYKPDFEGECEGKPWGKMWGGKGGCGKNWGGDG